jgi:hypothetical protein
MQTGLSNTVVSGGDAAAPRGSLLSRIAGFGLASGAVYGEALIRSVTGAANLGFKVVGGLYRAVERIAGIPFFIAKAAGALVLPSNPALRQRLNKGVDWLSNILSKPSRLIKKLAGGSIGVMQTAHDKMYNWAKSLSPNNAALLVGVSALFAVATVAAGTIALLVSTSPLVLGAALTLPKIKFFMGALYEGAWPAAKQSSYAKHPVFQHMIADREAIRTGVIKTWDFLKDSRVARANVRVAGRIANAWSAMANSSFVNRVVNFVESPGAGVKTAAVLQPARRAAFRVPTAPLRKYAPLANSHAAVRTLHHTGAAMDQPFAVQTRGAASTRLAQLGAFADAAATYLRSMLPRSGKVSPGLALTGAHL